MVAAGFAGGGVGVAGVQHDGAGVSVLEVGLADLHWGGLDPVAGEHPGGGDGATVRGGDQREVRFAGRLHAARDSGGFEAGNGSDAHGMSPRVGRPVVSGTPRTRFAACKA